MFTLPPLRYIISKRRFFSVEKSIKLVAFDMDGTVLDSKLRLPKGLFEMIESHPNVKFVVASGRQYYSLLNIFNPIKDKLILFLKTVEL